MLFHVEIRDENLTSGEESCHGIPSHAFKDSLSKQAKATSCGFSSTVSSMTTTAKKYSVKGKRAIDTTQTFYYKTVPCEVMNNHLLAALRKKDFSPESHNACSISS